MDNSYIMINQNQNISLFFPNFYYLISKICLRKCVKLRLSSHIKLGVSWTSPNTAGGTSKTAGGQGGRSTCSLQPECQ